MHISLRSFNQIENDTFMIEESLSMEELCEEVPHLVNLQPIQVKVLATRTKANLYRVNVEQTTKAILACSRCLKPFSLPLISEWEAQFTEETELVYEEEIQVLKAEHLDLTPFVREALLLEMPYAPICRVDCQGLCPVCGVDRNQISCGCEGQSIDPRWAKLQDLSEEG